MTASFEDSLRFPSIFIDSQFNDVDDESAITFCASFMGDSSVDLLSGGENPPLSAAIDTTPQCPPRRGGGGGQVPRIPRRRQSVLDITTNTPSMPPKPKRRSTKSSLELSCMSGSGISSLLEVDHDHRCEYLSANRFIALRFQKEQQQEQQQPMELPDLSDLIPPPPILSRNKSLERFQEEPMLRTSLELPAMPQRRRSIGSSADLFDSNDIGSLIETLPHDTMHTA